MQGEGQEFESPRLHHFCHSRTTNEYRGAKPQRVRGRGPRCDGSARTSRRFVYTDIAPLIRGNRPTDQRIAGGGVRKDPVEVASGRFVRSRPNLNNWICFGKLKVFNFAELCARCIPGHTAANRLVSCCGGQATKGTRWMPWRQEPMKDVAGCEKLRGVASRR